VFIESQLNKIYYLINSVLYEIERAETIIEKIDE